jgi:branched-chain amino acid transport system permease protein
MNYLIQLLIGGLSIGCIYSLVGIGFVIIFKSTKVLNLAQGELMMVGAYVTLLFYKSIGLPFFFAFAVSLGLAFVIGLAVEAIFMRKMIGKPIFSVVMLTLGLGVCLRGLVGLIWTYDEKTMAVSVFNKVCKLSNFSISYGEIIIILLSLALVFGLGIFYKYSKIGLGMRATAADQNSAMIMGIDVTKVFSFSWALSATVSTFGGIALAAMTIITPNMADFGVRALPAVVLGGIDSLTGVVVGGMIVGIAENLAGGYLGGMTHQLSPYFILLLVLVIRPYGLFGIKEIKRV